MEKIAELKRAKLLALSLLLVAAAAFITTLFLPQTFWVRGVKAIAEAAMVGALADWFAVVALFRRVPIPFISRHTAIIPRNKDRIGDNLGQFVQEKFLDTQSLVALIRRYEPAHMIGAWFSKPDNAQRVGLHLMQVMSGFLELTDDGRIQRLLKRAVHKAIDKVDFTETSAVMLESMTKNNRHQVLLDAIINRDWAAFRDILSHIILPASLLGYFSMAYISRMTRSFMLNELGQEYIVAARAKGLSERRIVWFHALRNAAVPLVTVIALSYAGLLEGSVLTETVFSWPGIGLYITNSLQNADMNAVLGGTIIIGAVFITINLLSDLLYRLLDPRTRVK